jgi:hypothetical protein
MTSAEAAAWAQAVAGIGTFGAAMVAVWATFRAPKSAAAFAEDLRAQSTQVEEARRLKLWVFATLMQYRGQLLNSQNVGALNSIDVVFRESREVRDAWRHFMAEANNSSFSSDRLNERYAAIIEKMARAMGLDAEITVKDIETAYYPKALSQFDLAAWLEAQDKLKRYGGEAAQNAAKPE